MTQIEVTTTLATVNCGVCGGVYAINERYREQCAQKGKSWRCPYCECAWGYSVGENARLKKEVEALKQKTAEVERQRAAAVAEAEHFRRSRDIIQGKFNHEKKRVRNGVCPCCRRSFTNLRRHMATKHPEQATAK